MFKTVVNGVAPTPSPSAGEITACVCGVVVGEMREAWQGEAGGEKRNSFQKI